MADLDAAGWAAWLAQGPGPRAHLLQTRAWGELKSAFGWQPAWVTAGGAGAQVLFRRLPLGLTLAYIPRGPVSSSVDAQSIDWPVFWRAVDTLCRRRRAVFLKVEPDAWADQAVWWAQRLPGFRLSPHSIQPPRTILIDISGSEEQILARMKQKTRYNIRLAEKKGVTVVETDQVERFARLMAVTGERDGFGVHAPAYYQRAYDLFRPGEQVALLLAQYDGQDLAGLMVFRHGPRAWYLYGASSDLERQRMPAYLLQWQAIRWAREHGCSEYDLWGVPDAELDELEAGFETRADGLWGVYRFKRGFGGELCRSAGAWDRVYNPLLYRLYLWRFAGHSEGG